MELIEYPNEKKCKLGFLDTVLGKWFFNPFSNDGEFQRNHFCSKRHVTIEALVMAMKMKHVIPF